MDYDNEKSESKNLKINLSIDDNKEKNISNSLHFDSVTNISFYFFLSESIYYILTYLTHRLVTLTVHSFYGLYNQSDLIGKVSYAFYTMNIFSSGIRNFQKPISIICGPLYSNGKFYDYRVQRNKLVIMNIIFCLLFCLLLPFLDQLFALLGVIDQNRIDIVKISQLYILIYTPSMCLVKFLKGSPNLKKRVNFRGSGSPAVSRLVLANECGILFYRQCSGLFLHRKNRLCNLRLCCELQCKIFDRIAGVRCRFNFTKCVI